MSSVSAKFAEFELVIADLRVENARLKRELAAVSAEAEWQARAHGLARRAMSSASEAMRSFEALVDRHFDAKEPLERVVDAARAFVEAQAPLASGDFSGDKFDELKAALGQAPCDPAVMALLAKIRSSS